MVPQTPLSRTESSVSINLFCISIFPSSLHVFEFIGVFPHLDDGVYNAIKGIAQNKNFQLVLDRASDAGIIFASPTIDISNEVLAKLGYSK